MSDRLLRAYHALPAPARSLVASVRGMQLRAWRYGRDTERLVDEALERERWSAGQWTAWREERLGRVLHRAATRVPHYRDAWAARRRRGDRAGWEYLEHWPVLDKAALRRDPRAFLADDVDPAAMYREHTSGTTGQPLQLWWSPQTVRAWYALFEARWRRWYGVSRRDRWAILGGQLVCPVARRRPPFWVWNAGLSQLYLSSYHLAPSLIRHYLDALSRYRVRYVWGYTSSLVALAEVALRTGWEPPPLAAVVTNAEPLDAAQRALIAAAFRCPARETYGMAEIVTAASECESNRLHLWPEVGVVEVHDAERPGAVGDLVCTGLLNDDMPLVRYAVGDRAALAHGCGEGSREDGAGGCTCGRTLPAFECVEGRADDALYTVDGRRVGRLDPVFKERLPVRAAQIVQETLGRVRVRYVPDDGFTRADGASITHRLRDRLGPVEVVLEAVDEIPRTANGKVRAVVCAVPSHERPEWSAACT